MRGRITFWVTCVCLVCCIAFMALHTCATLNQLTNSATDDLLRICRMSAMYLDNAAFSPSEGKDALKNLAAEVGVEMALLDDEGAVIAETRPSASTNAGNDEEVREALTGESGEGLDRR